MEEKLEGICRDTKCLDGCLEATTEGLAFHDVLGDVADHLLITSVVAVIEDVGSRVLIAIGAGPPDIIESGSGPSALPSTGLDCLRLDSEPEST